MSNAGDTTKNYVNTLPLLPESGKYYEYPYPPLTTIADWKNPDIAVNEKTGAQINGYLDIITRSSNPKVNTITPGVGQAVYSRFTARAYDIDGICILKTWNAPRQCYSLQFKKVNSNNNPLSTYATSGYAYYGRAQAYNQGEDWSTVNSFILWYLPESTQMIKTNIPVFEDIIPQEYIDNGDTSNAVNINKNRLDWVITVLPTYTGLITIDWNTDIKDMKSVNIYCNEISQAGLMFTVPYSDGRFLTTFDAIGQLVRTDRFSLIVTADNDDKYNAFAYLQNGVKPTLWGLGNYNLKPIIENIDCSITVRVAGKGKPDVIKPPSPNDPTDPDNPVDITDTESLKRGGDLITTFKITETQLHLIGQKLWSYSLLNASVFNLSSAPIENIISVKLMPVSYTGTIQRAIMCGNYATEQTGYVIRDTPPINIGNIDVPAYYNNFLDYEPYTQCSIYIPFIGFKGLAANYVVGHNISVTYVYDLVTGSCKVTVASDGAVFCEYDGECGIDLPLTSSNRAEVEAAQITSFVTSVATRNPLPMLNAATQSPTYESSGSVNSTCAAQLHLKCFVIIDRPISDLPQTYAHDYGMYCGITCSISNLSGFTVCNDNVDLTGIPCTDAEREMIRDYLIGGFYA